MRRLAWLSLWFFINATTIDPQEIQTADQQSAAALELIKAGLAWLALCVTLTGVAITEHLEPVTQYAQQNQGWKTCNKCGTVARGFATRCFKCRNRFPLIQGTPPVQPEPPRSRRKVTNGLLNHRLKKNPPARSASSYLIGNGRSWS